jgi:hypothetical protein
MSDAVPLTPNPSVQRGEGSQAAPLLPMLYRMMAAMALAVIFLLHLDQGLTIWGSIVLVVGAMAIVLRLPISPLFVLIGVVGGQLYLHFVFPGRRPRGVLQVEDVMLCTATLAYVGAHYRLSALWRSILPRDPRQRYHRKAMTIVPLGRLGKIVSQHRPATESGPGEMVWFLLQLLLFVLLAQGAWVVLNARRELLDFLSPREFQLVLLAWGLVMGLFLAAQLFRLARLLRMDRATAEVLLQDALWQETRGEQRRIGRWLAWWRLRRDRV